MRFLAFVVALAAAGPLQADPKKLVTARTGELPIILSAPHGGRQAIPNCPVRRGENVPQFATTRDDRTDELVDLLVDRIAKRLGGKPYVVIAHFERKYADANRPEDAALESDAARPYYRAYHKALEDYTREVQQKWKRGLVLDIHGQAGIPDALVRGTNDGKTVSLLEQRFGRQAIDGPKSIFGAMAANGYKVVPPIGSKDKEDRRYNGGHIVKTYGSHQGNGIDAIQLEFGSDLRRPNKLADTAQSLTDALEAFCHAYFKEAIRAK